MEEWLVVDGYNVIGAWPELRQLKRFNLAAARDRLTDILSEYAAYTAQHVVVVFDAQHVPGRGEHKYSEYLSVIFTDAEETADECIERLVGKLRDPYRRRLFVATSDYVEQRITFGRGALRISARELLQAVQRAETSVSRKVEDMKLERTTLGQGLSEEVKRRLEQLRRRQQS